MTIRAVIFDIGGVLFRMHDFGPWRAWETHLGLAKWQLGEIVFDNPVSRRAFVGQATAAEAWNEAARQLRLTPEELEALKADFWKGGAWDTELLDFIRSLRPHYRTGIISDAWPDAREAIQRYVNDDLFDVILMSGEEGVAKPGPEIFQRALSRLDAAPSEAIFVDDRAQNVEGARRIGMHAIQFNDSAQTRRDIQRLTGA
jgi:epoxide hydrolase-like predicted phosphatase